MIGEVKYLNLHNIPASQTRGSYKQGWSRVEVMNDPERFIDLEDALGEEGAFDNKILGIPCYDENHKLLLWVEIIFEALRIAHKQSMKDVSQKPSVTFDLRFWVGYLVGVVSIIAMLALLGRL